MRSGSTANPFCFEQQYEALRREAFRSECRLERGHGLALFLSQGMVAWMRALSTLLPAPKASSSELKASPSCRRPELTLGMRSDLRRILAGMVLACSRELAQ